MQYKLWNKTDPVILMDGRQRTPEELYQMPSFAFARFIPTMLVTDGPITTAIERLPLMRDLHKIDPALTDEDAVAAIKEAIENPPAPDAHEDIEAIFDIIEGRA